jgi:hypothetical protein
MFRDPQEIRRRHSEIVEKFRQKGATSPERALSLEELGLPPHFEQAMHRRLGQTGIFVEVNGKYYLNEDTLRRIQQERSQGANASGGRGYNEGRPPSWLRYAGILLMLPIGLIVVVLLYFFVSQTGATYYPGEFLIVLLVIMVIVFAARMLLWRSRRRYYQNWQNGSPLYEGRKDAGFHCLSVWVFLKLINTAFRKSFIYWLIFISFEVGTLFPLSLISFSYTNQHY